MLFGDCRFAVRWARGGCKMPANSNVNALASVLDSSAPLARRVAAIIESDPSFGMGTQEIAHALGVSKYYVCHKFKEETGISVSDYILERRLTLAGELLQSSSLCVRDIARRVGYSADSYFIRRFKQKYGVTPGRMRELMRGSAK